MSVSANKGSNKWTCHICTFDNHMSAVRCAMCYTALKIKGNNNTNTMNLQNDNISQQQSTLLITHYDNSHGSSQNQNRYCRNNNNYISEVDSNHGWSCPSCSCENYQNSFKCTFCGWISKKGGIRTNNSNNNNNNGVKRGGCNKKNEVGRQEDGKNGNGSSVSKRITTTTQPTCKMMEEMQFYNEKNSNKNSVSSGNNSNYHSSGNSTTIIASSKWICKHCTYENYAKSLRCVMCRNPHDCQTINRINSDKGVAAIREHVSSSPGNCRKTSSVTTDRIQGKNEQDDRYITYTPSEELIENSCGSDVKIDNHHSYSSIPINDVDINQIKNQLSTEEWLWLNACQGVQVGHKRPVEDFIASGGNLSRQLTSTDIILLKWTNSVEIGYTLVHLAIKYDHEELLNMLLTPVVDRCAHKCLPSDAQPELAQDIREMVAMSIRQRKGDWPCYFTTNIVTFALPAEIRSLSTDAQEQLFNDIVDKDVQKELEIDLSIINWSYEVMEDLDSRLYTLWNRTAGDCLLDSVMQVTWGIMDESSVLRCALRDSLREGEDRFYQRWREAEAIQTSMLEFSLDEEQWLQDWSNIIEYAGRKGAPLEQMHIFTLAHIMRRPIVVYGVKYVNSYKGESLGLARFQGIYLPLLWEKNFCASNPIVLAYTRGHFSAIVGIESDRVNNAVAGANVDNNENTQTVYLPLVDSGGVALPVHFLTGSEIGCEEQLLHEWLDCDYTSSGILVAKQRITQLPLQVNRMVDNWLDKYRKLDS